MNRMDDLISRQAAIDAADYTDCTGLAIEDVKKVTDEVVKELKKLPPVEQEISRIEQELHGKTPEEQYEFLYWLLLKFGLAYTDSRLAVIEWLRGEKEDE